MGGPEDGRSHPMTPKNQQATLSLYGSLRRWGKNPQRLG
jgi:hypothetical protein